MYNPVYWTLLRDPVMFENRVSNLQRFWLHTTTHIIVHVENENETEQS